MRINSEWKTYSAMYDFAVYGGAIGTINLQSPLFPGFCTAIATAYIIEQPDSAGSLANIAFGYTGIGANAIFPSANVSNWASSGVICSTDPVDGFNFQNPILPAGGNFTFTISIEALTVGKIIISVSGTQFPAGF